MRPTFNFTGYVSILNYRICGDENHRVIHEKPLHAQRSTVRCGFWAGGVTGLYLFRNEAGNAVTVNGVHYRKKIREFLRRQ